MMAPRNVSAQTCGCADFPTYKCITSGNLPDLINDPNEYLLDYTKAQTDPQFIVVESDINFQDPNNTDPYYFAEGSVIIMLQDAALSIRKEVVFNGATIGGCGDAWRGIDVYSSGRLRTILGTSISNACRAISLKANSRAEITSTFFANNGICIEATGNVQTLGEGIAHNTFFGDNYTISCGGLGARWAITLENVPHITIGNMTGSGAPNEFTGYDGIFADNSSLDVYNTTFEDQPAGTGILLRGTGGIFTANITGLGNELTDPAFMKDFDMGIDAKNYDLTVNNAYFNEATEHHIKINDSKFPTRLYLTENRFDQYKQDAVSIALSTFRNVLIWKNEFRDNSSDDFEKSGIRWNRNELAGFEPSASISENTFYDDAKTSPDPDFLQFQFYGISVNGSSGLNIADNYFYQNYESAIDHNYKGIWLSNAPRNELVSNGIFGNFGPKKSTVFDFSYRGIDIRESAECFVSCNHSEGLNEGFHFRGPACDKADFRNNEMQDNLTGLYLYPGSIIGTQKDQQNKWSGGLPTGGVAEAQFDGSPGQGELDMSLFSINSSNSNSILWANPRIPANSWFEPSSSQEGLPFLYLKEEGPLPPKSKADEMLIGGGFESYKGYPASEWDATLNAFSTLDRNPELRPENSDEEDFYDAHYSGNIGKFHRARSEWDNIALFLEALEEDWAVNVADIDDKLDEIRVEVLEMEAADPETEQAGIAATLETLKNELASLQLTNQDLSDEYKSDVIDKANELDSDLAAITTTEVWEDNLKTVLELSVEKLLSGNETWTAPQYEALEDIANQCRHEGGIGVVLARSAIEKFDYDDEAMCPGWEEERSAKSVTFQADVYPNPANDLCRLAFAQPLSGFLVVRNAQGQLMYTMALSQATVLNLITVQWPAGLYTINVTAENSAHCLGKLAISH